MAKSANRRKASATLAIANGRRAASKPKVRRERDTAPGPFEPLRINYWCGKLGLTHDILAERTGYSVEYISQMANGRRRFNQEILDAFAHAMDNISRAALLPLPNNDPVAEILNLSPGEQARYLAMFKAANAPGD